ncbi:MAG TPA: hypothetical protein VEA44_16150 [Caulobacter sp.]|nr:hypothetical protein [Caulobacter sp.]
MEPQGTQIDFRNYAGPVARAFELSRAKITPIIGPTGGGKTQAACRRILRVALAQDPSPRDGVRKARITVVCPTYRRAHDTVIPSYLQVWPKSWGSYRGGKGDPVDHIFDIPNGGKPLHIEVLFRAVQDESLEEFVRGIQTTAWWFPEMDTMPQEDLLSLASNRVGRYPEPDDRPDFEEGKLPAYAGVWGDANAPVIGSWFHTRFYLERHLHRETDKVFFQPPALLEDGTQNPAAENLHNLRKINANYYTDLAATMEDYDIGRLLMCKPGYSRFGKPVHDQFDHATMVSLVQLAALPDVELEISIDAGNTLMPAATFAQRVMGQRRVLAEIAPHYQMDLVEFAQEIRRVRETLFGHVKAAKIRVDPSAGARTTTNRQITYAQLIQQITGIPVLPAPSNDPLKRRSALVQVMKRRNGYIIDGTRCPNLVAALSGGFRFKKVGNIWAPNPEKNEHSHVAEAEEYGALSSEGLGLIPPPRQPAQSGQRRAILPGG